MARYRLPEYWERPPLGPDFGVPDLGGSYPGEGTYPTLPSPLYGDADMGTGLDPVDPAAAMAFENEQRYGATLPSVLEPGALTEDNPATRPFVMPDLGAPIRDFANAPDANLPAGGVPSAALRGLQELARGTQPTQRGKMMQDAGYEYDIPGLRGLANIGERTIGRQDANTLADRWYNGTPVEKVLDIGGQAIPTGAMPFARSMLPGGVMGGALEVAGELAGGTAVGPTQAALRAASGVNEALPDSLKLVGGSRAAQAGEVPVNPLSEMGQGADDAVTTLRGSLGRSELAEADWLLPDGVPIASGTGTNFTAGRVNHLKQLEPLGLSLVDVLDAGVVRMVSTPRGVSAVQFTGELTDRQRTAIVRAAREFLDQDAGAFAIERMAPGGVASSSDFLTANMPTREMIERLTRPMAPIEWDALSATQQAVAKEAMGTQLAEGDLRRVFNSTNAETREAILAGPPKGADAVIRQPPPTPPRVPDVGPAGEADDAAAELLGDMGGGAAGGVMGLRQAAQGLPAYERIANRFRAAVGMAQTNDLATPIMQERKRIKEVARNQAAVIGAEAGARVRQAFQMDKNGLVKGLDDVNFPDGMTVQDAAARLPTVWDNMTPQQQATMRWLQESLAPYRQLWDDVQAEAGALVDRNAKAINSRADVMDGGFYIPRGSADIAGMDEPVKVRVSGGTGAGKGFQRAATFDSAAEGIANGYEYASVDDAIRSYVRNIGDDIANRATANTLLELTDDTGKRLATSAADRVDPQLRGAVQQLAGQIGQRRITALSRRVRAGAQGAEAGRADRMAERADILAQNAEKRLWQRVTKESPDTVIAAAERELLVLRREASKDLNIATKRRGVSNATATKLQATLQELDDFQNQLTVLRGRYERAQDVAKSTPRERGRVDMVELQAYDFPDEIANAANMALKEEARLTNPGVLDRAAQILQGAYRTTTATLDNSAVGIQGLLGWYGDPKAASKALGVNLKSMLDKDAFGAFVQRFDENAKGRNLPDVMQWTRSGLRVAGPGEEMRAGAGLGKLTQKVRDLPGIKQTDRMFTAMGDSLRLGWAQDEAETMMRQLGRPLTDQELEGIAKSINRFTGYTSDPAGGAISDLLMYSPRYFQSRIETTLNAAASLRPGATLEQKLARRTVARTLVGGAMITYAANAALGQETDARPVVTDGHGGWKRNPNFMRIRFNDKDFSVFGGYDSLLGLVLTAATGKHDQALRQFMTGPVPSMGWDLFVGSTVDGKRTRDKPEQLLKYLAESFAPFSAGDIGGSLVAGGQAAMAGDPVKAAAGATAAGLTFMGAKQSPMSYDDIRTELVQGVVREAMAAGNPDGYTADTTIDGLSKADMRKVYEDKRLKAKGDQFEDAPISDAQRIQQAGGEYDVKRQNLDAKLGDAISKGMTGKDLKDAIQQWKRDGFTAYDTTLGNPEVTAAAARLSREKRPPMRDQLAQKYWDVPMEELPNGEPDFRGQQAAREAILNEARGLGYDTTYITDRGPNTYRGQSIKDERVREVVERYEKAQEALRPYWELKEKLAAEAEGYRAKLDQLAEAEALPPGLARDLTLQRIRGSATYKLYEDALERKKNALRRDNENGIDKALVEWYGYKPYSILGPRR